MFFRRGVHFREKEIGVKKSVGVWFFQFPKVEMNLDFGGYHRFRLGKKKKRVP